MMEQKKEYVSPKMYIEDFKQRTCLLGGSPDSIDAFLCNGDCPPEIENDDD